MKHTLIFTALILSLTSIMFSCEKDDTQPEAKGFAKGVFISCEGTFSANNGSISWYDDDSAKIINNLFEMVNGRPAGDVIQSFSVAGDYGVIIANNSGKVEIVDMDTFISTGTITGLSYPRYFAWAGNDHGYISNGNFRGEIYKVNLKLSQITDTIETCMGPEQMVIVGDNLFVANSGGWSAGNTVSVISTLTGELVQTVTVGDIPVAMVKDVNNDVWVLCRGKVVYNDTWTEITDETDSRLVRIDAGTMSVSRDIIIGETGDYFNPSWLAICPAGERLLFGEAAGLFVMETDDPLPPSEPLVRKRFSAAGVHPVSGLIFALEITDYTSQGLLHIYDGTAIVSSFETGIAPGGLVFADR